MERIIKFKPLNECIYCRSKTNLSDEHILPLALHGRWILPKASCKKCADITSSFELDVCRNIFGETRAYLKFPTRRKHPADFSMTIEKKGTKEALDVPIMEYGGRITFFFFTPPAYLLGRKDKTGINICGSQLYRIGGIEEKQLVDKYNAKAIEFHMKTKPTNFARMLAKIAYGFAVSKYGLNNFRPLILPAILGEKDDIGMWVGCEAQEQENFPKEDFVVNLSVKEDIIYSRIKFFGKFEQVPTYLVVVGEIKNNEDRKK
ncbi:MAG: hypothetical protein A2Z69_03385 [Bacteroidetes bacterium RBG_13_44_24]|nr:MAG: hypothetical protein A2Z69_03385 [Bacteroidetes bacterium RBG_13_44_24]